MNKRERALKTGCSNNTGKSNVWLLQTQIQQSWPGKHTRGVNAEFFPFTPGQLCFQREARLCFTLMRNEEFICYRRCVDKGFCTHKCSSLIAHSRRQWLQDRINTDKEKRTKFQWKCSLLKKHASCPWFRKYWEIDDFHWGVYTWKCSNSYLSFLYWSNVGKARRNWEQWKSSTSR